MFSTVGTEKETVRGDLDSGEHAAEEDGDLQDEEEDQDAEVAENKQKATDRDDRDLGFSNFLSNSLSYSSFQKSRSIWVGLPG